MFQKQSALLNQTTKSLLYRFSISYRIPALIATLTFLCSGIAAAQTPAIISNRLSRNIFNLRLTGVIISNGTLLYYVLGICLVIGILILALVIGSNIRKQRKEKGLEQQRIIAQMQLNEERSQALNAELCGLLESQTIELKKSMEIIEKQNEEISMMTAMLKDTKGLNPDAEQTGKIPVISKFEDFEAFSKIYPDKDSILKYIAGLKWNKGYSCIRCCNETYLAGQTPYGRRCTKCGYDESATVNTIFHNSKILLNKALYMLIMVYNTKGAISSYKLAGLLDIRQSTCWVYSSRFKKKLLQNKAGFGKADGEGWSQMVLEQPV